MLAATGFASHRAGTRPKSISSAKDSYSKSKVPFKYPEPSAYCTKIIDEQDTSSIIHLRIGDTLCVILSVASGTGYEWELVSLDTTIIHRIGKLETQVPINIPEGYTGYPERKIWHFEAASEGNATLSMEYRRSWEKDKPSAKSFKKNILVDGL